MPLDRWEIGAEGNEQQKNKRYAAGRPWKITDGGQRKEQEAIGRGWRAGEPVWGAPFFKRGKDKRVNGISHARKIGTDHAQNE